MRNVYELEVIQCFMTGEGKDSSGDCEISVPFFYVLCLYTIFSWNEIQSVFV
jgi:hypothetical protein